MALVNKSEVYVDDGGSSRSTKLVYDPKTGKWVPASATSGSSGSSGSKKPSSPVNKNPSTEKTGSKSSKTNSKKKAEKKYIEAEFNVLTGEMRVTPTSKSIRIKVNDTVKIEGLGNYLSGNYFVSSVSRIINASNGYSHSFVLLKNGFGKSVKDSSSSDSSDTKTESRTEEVVKVAPELKVGDSVKIVGEDAVYSNAHDGVKVPEWVKKKTLTIRQISDDKTRVLLMPIYSWTYAKFIQKV